MPPSKVAEYELYKRIKLLGEGSFGKAYLVECLQDKSQWVIKYMDLTSMTPQEKEETLRESKIIEFLNHPNIVKFREVYKTQKGKLCIVMEYADGGDIGQKIKAAKGQYFSENQILDWFTQICLALKHVHDRKIIHRDLKGQNIFLTKDNRVKLGDFGIARILKKTMEKAKTMVGTPYYISPEIIEGKPYTQTTDIWSIGVILYELCALQPPFNADSLHFLALKIVKGSYNPIPIHYTKELKNLVAQLLNVDYRRRPTISEILKMPVITNRIKGFLSETVRQQEFSHTVFHNRYFEPKGNLNAVNVISKEAPCPPQLLEQNARNLQEFPQIQQARPDTQQSEAKKGNQDLIRPPVLGSKPKSEPSRPKVVEPVKPVVVKQEQPKQIEPLVKRQHSNSDQAFPAPPEQVVKSPSAQQFISPANVIVQKQPVEVKGRPPTAAKDVKPKPPLSQRPQSSKPVDVGQDRQKAQKIVVEKKRPISVDKQAQPSQQIATDRQNERIKLLKQKEQEVKNDVIKKEEQRVQAIKDRQIKDNQLKENQLKEQQQQQQQQKQLQLQKQQQQELEQQQKQKQKQQLQQQQQQQQQQQIQQQQQPLKQKEQQKKSSDNVWNQQGQSNQSNLGGQPKKSQEGQFLLDRMQEKGIEFEQMLRELEMVLGGMSEAVDKLPQQNGKEHIFDYNTALIPNQLLEDREDDEDEPAQKGEYKQKEVARVISQEEEDCLEALNCNKISTLKVSLMQQLGKDKFEKAYRILTDQLARHDLDYIESKYGPKYEVLLPFMTYTERKTHVPLLFTYIITGASNL